jgi:adenylate cyclase
MRILREDGSEPGAIVRHVWQSGLIAAAAAALVFLLGRTTPFQDFDRWTYDFTVINAGLEPPDKRIVLVDFDDETFEKVKQFPIPRSMVAEAVAAIGAQKPRTVGMDILLSEPRTADEDKAMQDALTGAGNVVLTSQFSGGDIPTDMPLAMFCQPENPKAESGFCKEGTPGALGYAYINMPIDPDGFVRQVLMFASSAGAAQGFAITMAQQYSGQPMKPVDRRRFSFLGRTLWYSDAETNEILIGSWGRQPATTISAWKVLAGGLPKDTFTDKLVLMGQSSDAARDRHYTPMFRYSLPDGSRPSMAGTQVMAAAIKSLLDGTVVRLSPRYIVEIAILAMCWMCSFIVLELRTKVGMTVAVLFLTVPFLLSLTLYMHARFWLPFLGQEAGLAMTLPITLFVQFISERVLAREARSQRMQLMTLFSSYVDPAVAGTIWDRRDEVSLNGEERVATVMFTDIRSFTALSAGKPPAEVLTWLNQYMTAMDGVIRLHGGFLNKFIGDGLMIIFGLPLSHGPRHDAGRGLHAAIAMLKRVEELNVENAPFPERPQLRIGVGIHTGSLMAGSIGSANRQEYSVIGETVNLASRLESLNKPFKTEILMSKATYDLLAEDFTGFEALGPAQVAGFEEPVEVYTIREGAAKSKESLA